MSSSFVTPNYLIPYVRPASLSDYRCVINGAGTKVLFERSPIDKSGRAKEGDSTLYVLDLVGSGNKPTPFLQGSPETVYQNRPDWSWQTAGSVAFNWGRNKGLGIEVGIAESGGSNPTRLKETAGMEYPTWFPDGTLAVTYYSKKKPHPNTSHIKQDGKTATILEFALAGPSYWAGMPSVNQASPNLIAFAGQLVEKGEKYEQDQNYIWVMDTSKTPVSVRPLEGSGLASGPFQPDYQARAPWWSPDGNWLVFESYRASQPANGSKGMYAIYLFDYSTTGATAVQVTDPMYNMNHAKWYPNGFNHVTGDQTLVVAAYQQDGKSAALPYGIASLDVSSIINSAAQNRKKNT
jgi:hypothetical protein